jgi:hypothetical protein
VPIEAVYAYVEAKHTLCIEGDGPQSLAKAIAQVENVRKLVSKREPVRAGQVIPLFNLNDCGIAVTIPDYLPPIANPLFTMIVARNVKQSQADKTPLNPEAVKQALQGIVLESWADLVVAGESVVVVPTLPVGQNAAEYKSIFFLKEKYQLQPRQVDGTAFGIAIASLWAAIEWIQLGRMRWHDIIADALGLEPKPK